MPGRAARPRAVGPLPPFFQGEAEQCHVGRPLPFPGPWGPSWVPTAPSRPWVRLVVPSPVLPEPCWLGRGTPWFLELGGSPQGSSGGFRLFCNIPENHTETDSPAGTTQAHRNNQHLYLGWIEMGSKGHQARRAEQKFSLAEKCISEPGAWGLSVVQHVGLTGWTPSFQPAREGSGDKRGLVVGVGSRGQAALS